METEEGACGKGSSVTAVKPRIVCLRGRGALTRALRVKYPVPLTHFQTPSPLRGEGRGEGEKGLQRSLAHLRTP
jgi:hypothetical protein